jgi:hypothetical protein
MRTAPLMNFTSLRTRSLSRSPSPSVSRADDRRYPEHPPGFPKGEIMETNMQTNVPAWHCARYTHVGASNVPFNPGVTLYGDRPVLRDGKTPNLDFEPANAAAEQIANPPEPLNQLAHDVLARRVHPDTAA